MEIRGPVVLTRLPRSSQENAGVTFGSVLGLRNGVKRKRHEVCACVDGHSVNIYGVHAGNSVASYAVPPSSVFIGPPCSLRWKENGSTMRQTYCTMKRDGLRLHSFQTEDAELPRHASGLSLELENQVSSVIHLDLLNGHGSDIVVLVQDDGTITQSSRDLKKESCQKIKPRSEKASLKLVAAQAMLLREAKATILKARSDLASGQHDEDIVLAVAYYKTDNNKVSDSTGNSIFYGVWLIRQHQLLPSQSEQLIEHELRVPGTSQPSSEPPSIRFGHRSSSLQIKTAQSYTQYDLLAIVPRKLTSLRIGLPNCQDILNISSTYILAAFSNSLQVLDLNYEVAHASLELSPSLKRNKPGSSTTSGPMEFVGYFSQLQRCLAKRRNQLVLVDIKFSSDINARHPSVGLSLLVQNIGRGIPSSETRSNKNPQLGELTIGSFKTSSTLPTGWLNVRNNLEQCLKANDVPKFERTLLQDLQQSAYIPDVKVVYVLSKMFSLGSLCSEVQHGKLEQTSLILNFSAPTLVKLLSQKGLLTSGRLARALELPGNTSGYGMLQVESIARALQNADESLDLLAVYLQNDSCPDIQVHSAIVKLLITQALPRAANGTVQPALADVAAESPSDRNLVVALSQPSSSPESLSPGLRRSLTLGLERFGTMSSPTISSQLREGFSQTQILGIIQFLRQQLFTSGHTSSLQGSNYPSPSPSKDHSASRIKRSGQPQQHSGALVSFDSTIKILSGCVDALGPLGLFAAGEDERFVEHIIPDLLSEVTLATQSVEDSANLRGILRETLRFAESKQHKSGPGSSVVHSSGEPTFGSRVGGILTLYTEETEGEKIGGSNSVLPLSLRAEEKTDSVKMRKGGGQTRKRTTRETMMLENRLKGTYSFERLVL